jgi:hypothetical protein
MRDDTPTCQTHTKANFSNSSISSMTPGRIFLLAALITTMIMFILNYFVDFEGYKMALYMFSFATLCIFFIAFPPNC